MAAATLAAAGRPAVGRHMLKKLTTIMRHVWLDASDAERAVPPDMLARLTKQVAASEAQHSGEIRIYVEAALPLSYLRRLNGGNGQLTSMAQLIRQRATMLFGKLRVWDTNDNNGVLIYLQLAEHAIEIVADRGLHARVTADEWQALVARMSGHFKQGQFEAGLTDALTQVSALLTTHFPEADVAPQPNGQPDEPTLS